MTSAVCERSASEYDPKVQDNECAASVIRSDYITRTEIVKLHCRLCRLAGKCQEKGRDGISEVPRSRAAGHLIL